MGILLLLLACGGKPLFQRSFEGNEWLSRDTLRWEMAAEDSLRFRLSGHYTPDYPYQNLYLRLWIQAPHGKVRDTILLDTLSNPLGEWRTENKRPGKLPFQRSFSLPVSEKGTYRLKCAQYMRTDTLRGVKAMAVD